MAPGARARSKDQEDQGDEFTLALEEASRGIRNPVAKLKYIRGSLARYQAVRRSIEMVPWAPLRLLLYRWLSWQGLSRVLAPQALGAPMRAPVPGPRLLAAVRFGTVAAVLTTVAAVAALVYRPLRPPAVEAPVAAAAPAPRPLVAEALSPLPAGAQPARVWIVEKGPGFEQYSHGLRIDTSFTVDGEPRHFRAFDAKAGLLPELHQAPVGIVFHTSESDVWSLEEANNERLRDSSQHLLLYVQRLRLYNYLVDRFGRVFRVVEDAGKANHAGNAIWALGDTVYLSLNHASLGICFESRWGGGRALPITSAQLAAGRALTEYLRQRWEIAPGMCVAHGLVSVNPRQHLIGHHVDWARGFPFEAFGLPDQYAVPPPSVALFGFGYDDDFLRALGEPWAGVRKAERALAEEAARQGRGAEEVRREKQDLYDRWHEEQSRDEDATSAARAVTGVPQRGPRGG